MSTQRIDDIRAFRSFLDEMLAQAGDDLTLDGILELWEFENASDREREATLAAIREGLEDADAGKTRPAREVLSEVQRKFNLPG